MNISKPHFLLKTPKSDSETLISLFVRFNGQRLVHSTGAKIHPDKWNFKTQRANGSKKDLEISELNYWLDKIDSSIKQIFWNLKNQGTVPTPELLKKELSALLNDRPIVRKTSF